MDKFRQPVNQPEEPVKDHRCAYYAGTKRCNHGGTSSENIRLGGPWFCTFHFRNRDPYSKDAHKVVEDSYKAPDAHQRQANEDLPGNSR